MNLKLIYNPAAGRGRAQRTVPRVAGELRRLQAHVEIYASSSPADLTRAAAESSRSGFDRTVVCGGDGTLHHALREFDLSRGVLAVVPLGSGDDFARVAGIPHDVRGACDVAVNGTVREVDVALANGIRYVGVAGAGFDSEVAAFANRVRVLRGSAVYLYAILRVLRRFKPRAVRFSVDATERTFEMMFLTVGNSSQYGGGIRILPDAVIDDGTLDFCVVHRTSVVQLLRTLPLAYKGGHIERPYVETGRGTTFRLESEQPLEIYADGERVTMTPVTFGVAGEKLRLVTPPLPTR